MQIGSISEHIHLRDGLVRSVVGYRCNILTNSEQEELAIVMEAKGTAVVSVNTFKNICRICFSHP